MESGERLGSEGVPAKAEGIGRKCGNWLRRFGIFPKGPSWKGLGQRLSHLIQQNVQSGLEEE